MVQNLKHKKIKKETKRKKPPQASKFRKSQPVATPSQKRLQSAKQVHVHKSNRDITKVINKNIELQMVERANTHKERLSILK